MFDSGVGGLTVLHELLVSLPGEDYLYLGDTARFPYGDRTRAELRTFATEIAEHLVQQKAKLVVIACGSASAAAVDAVESRLQALGHDIHVIDVLHPAAQQAVVTTHSGRIGLLATPATVTSGAYERAIAAADPHVQLRSVSCPDLAPIIQSGFPFDEAVVDTVRRVLRAIARGHGGHGHPRVDPLPTLRPDSPAHAGPRRFADRLGHGGGPQRRAGSGRPRPAQSPSR